MCQRQVQVIFKQKSYCFYFVCRQSTKKGKKLRIKQLMLVEINCDEKIERKSNQSNDFDTDNKKNCVDF